MCGMTDHEHEWEWKHLPEIYACECGSELETGEAEAILNEHAALKRVRDTVQKYRENPTFKNKMDMYDLIDALEEGG